jgi:hypothetical protein
MTASYVVYIRHATIGNRAEQIANEQSCCSTGLPSYRQALASHSIPMRMWSAPNIPKRQPTSVSAGQPWCGAPRRNRTGDPILTMANGDLVLTFSKTGIPGEIANIRR